MIKKLKQTVAFMMTILMVLGSVIPTYAAEASEDNLQVDLEIIKISTEYNKEDYEVVYDFGAESNNAYIYEKSTNRIVEEYEEIIQEVSGKARVAAGYRNVDVYTYFYPSSANLHIPLERNSQSAIAVRLSAPNGNLY